MFPLVLLLADTDLVSKKDKAQKNLVKSFRFSNGKIILILLIEVVAFYIEFIIVYIWGVSF